MNLARWHTFTCYSTNQVRHGAAKLIESSDLLIEAADPEWFHCISLVAVVSFRHTLSKLLIVFSQSEKKQLAIDAS